MFVKLVLMLGVCFNLCSAFSVNSLSGMKMGGCPDFPVKENFDVNRFMTTWYEIERSDVFYGRGLKCGKSEMSRNAAGNVDVRNSGTTIANGQVTEKTGVATIPDANQPAKMSLRTGRMPWPVNYWVLDTDYDAYSVIYSCKGFGAFHFDIVWILSRHQAGLSTEHSNIARAKITQLGMDITRLKPQSQEGCNN